METGDGPLLVLDISEKRTDAVIVSQGEATFVRTLSRGTQGLPATAGALARELRQSLAAHRLAGGEAPVAIVVVGPGASTPGASTFLEEELGIPIRPLPAQRVRAHTPAVAEGLANRLPRFAKAFGLALAPSAKNRAFNLRTGALQAEQGYPFLREKFPVLFGLAAVIVASFGFSYLSRSKSLAADKDVALARLAQVSGDILGETTTDVDRAKELLEHGPSAEDDPLPKADAFDVMVQISKAVPKEVVHDVIDLDIQRGHVVLQGAVPSVTDAQRIADGIKEHRCFKEMKGVRSAQFGPDRLKYTIEFDIKCEDKKKAAGAVGSASAAMPAKAPPVAAPAPKPDSSRPSVVRPADKPPDRPRLEPQR
jgi:general secretion pathway protein L